MGNVLGMVGYTLHVNQQLHHDKACSRIADVLVEARDMILTDFLLVCLTSRHRRTASSAITLSFFSRASNERPEARSTIR